MIKCFADESPHEENISESNHSMNYYNEQFWSETQSAGMQVQEETKFLHVRHFLIFLGNPSSLIIGDEASESL